MDKNLDITHNTSYYEEGSCYVPKRHFFTIVRLNFSLHVGSNVTQRDHNVEQNSSIDGVLYGVAEPIAATLGVVVWGIRVLRAKGVTIQVFIDTIPSEEKQQDCDVQALSCPTDAGQDSLTCSHTQGGVSVETCALFSRLLSTELDIIESTDTKESLLLQKLPSYTLEVSTPGIERQFFTCGQLSHYIGSELQVQLNEPLVQGSSQRKYKGILQKVEEEAFTLQTEGEEALNIPWRCTARVVNKARYDSKK